MNTIRRVPGNTKDKKGKGRDSSELQDVTCHMDHTVLPATRHK